jgi:hypothetical protein
MKKLKLNDVVAYSADKWLQVVGFNDDKIEFKNLVDGKNIIWNIGKHTISPHNILTLEQYAETLRVREVNYDYDDNVLDAMIKLLVDMYMQTNGKIESLDGDDMTEDIISNSVYVDGKSYAELMLDAMSEFDLLPKNK